MRRISKFFLISFASLGLFSLTAMEFGSGELNIPFPTISQVGTGEGRESDHLAVLNWLIEHDAETPEEVESMPMSDESDKEEDHRGYPSLDDDEEVGVEVDAIAQKTRGKRNKRVILPALKFDGETLSTLADLPKSPHHTGSPLKTPTTPATYRNPPISRDQSISLIRLLHERVERGSGVSDKIGREIAIRLPWHDRISFSCTCVVAARLFNRSPFRGFMETRETKRRSLLRRDFYDQLAVWEECTRHPAVQSLVRAFPIINESIQNAEKNLYEAKLDTPRHKNRPLKGTGLEDHIYSPRAATSRVPVDLIKKTALRPKSARRVAEDKKASDEGGIIEQNTGDVRGDISHKDQWVGSLLLHDESIIPLVEKEDDSAIPLRVEAAQNILDSFVRERLENKAAHSSRPSWDVFCSSSGELCGHNTSHPHVVDTRRISESEPIQIVPRTADNSTLPSKGKDRLLTKPHSPRVLFLREELGRARRRSSSSRQLPSASRVSVSPRKRSGSPRRPASFSQLVEANVPNTNVRNYFLDLIAAIITLNDDETYEKKKIQAIDEIERELEQQLEEAIKTIGESEMLESKQEGSLKAKMRAFLSRSGRQQKKEALVEAKRLEFARLKQQAIRKIEKEAPTLQRRVFDALVVLLQPFIRVNLMKDGEGRTLLHQAIDAEHIPLVRALLSRHADPHAYLSSAIDESHEMPRAIRDLMFHYSNLFAQGLLRTAIDEVDLELAAFALRRKGIDFTSVSKDRIAILHVLIRELEGLSKDSEEYKSLHQMYLMFRRAGATSPRRESVGSPIQIAALNRRWIMVKEMAFINSIPNAVRLLSRDLLREALKKGENPNQIAPMTGLAPIHLLIRKWDEIFYRKDTLDEGASLLIDLLNAGAALHLVDGTGHSVHSWLLQGNAYKLELSMVNNVLQRLEKESIERIREACKACKENSFCRSRVFDLSTLGDLKSLKDEPYSFVLINLPDINGRTPLHVAAAAGHREVVEYLLSRGAEVDACDAQDLTALHYAACQPKSGIYDILVNAGAREDAEDIYGTTPALIAAYARKRLLLKVGRPSSSLVDRVEDDDIAALFLVVRSLSEGLPIKDLFRKAIACNHLFMILVLRALDVGFCTNMADTYESFYQKKVDGREGIILWLLCAWDSQIEALKAKGKYNIKSLSDE